MGFAIAIAGLGLVIFIHELGHFLAGKAVGVKIYEFMLGLPIGPKLVSYRKGETTYGISAFLLGGYVRPAETPAWGELSIQDVKEGSSAQAAGFVAGDIILSLGGEEAVGWKDVAGYLAQGGRVTVRRAGRKENLDVPAGVTEGLVLDSFGLDISEISRTVEARTVWQKIILVAAGPLMNIVLAYALIAAILMAGFPGKASTTLAGVTVGSGAAKAGIRAGDRITSINGKSIESWNELRAVIKAEEGRAVIVAYERDGRTRKARVRIGTDEKKGRLGVIAGNELAPVSPQRAIVDAGKMTWSVALAVGDTLRSLFTAPRKIVGSLRSPVGAVAETAPIAQQNFLAYVAILAQLSIGIGILNLLPIPPLDGGRVVVSIIEAVSRRALPREVMAAANLVGVSLLLFLMVYLVGMDISRLAGGGG